jgi:hypothetical protein
MPEIVEPDAVLTSVAHRVTQERERVRLRVGDREIAVISLEDLDFLEDLEDRLDLLDALEALREAAEDKRLIRWEDILDDIKHSRQADVV